MSEKVYFIKLKDNASIPEQVEALQKLFVAGDLDRVVAKNDFVAIKMHVGEKNNSSGDWGAWADLSLVP